MLAVATRFVRKNLRRHAYTTGQRVKLIGEDCQGHEFNIDVHSRWIRECCGPFGAASQRLYDVCDKNPDVKDATINSDNTVTFRFDDIDETFNVSNILRAIKGSEGSTMTSRGDLKAAGYSVYPGKLPSRSPWGRGDLTYEKDLVRADWSTSHHESRKTIGHICERLLTHGAAIVCNVPRNEGEIVQFLSKHIGPVRVTDWGQHFDVRTKQNKISNTLIEDVAYSNEGIDLHHDNPYRSPVPGYWCLHCLEEGSGGGGLSLISDGLHVALSLKREEPELFDVLTKMNVNFRYYGQGATHEYVRPHIQLRRPNQYEWADDFNIESIAYSGRLDAMSHEGRTFEDMDLFYKAKRAFLRIARESAVTFKLQQGDLVILDNTRVMHGRTKIIPSKNSEVGWGKTRSPPVKSPAALSQSDGFASMISTVMREPSSK
eukprot:g3203.t1